MKKLVLLLGVMGVFFAGVVYYQAREERQPKNEITPEIVPVELPAKTTVTLPINSLPAPMQKNLQLSITSPVFEMNGSIPTLYTCDGKNISPQLNFSNIPGDTRSLALTMEDPDVPKSIRADGMWNHWVLWNIAPSVTEVKEGTNPSGSVLGRTTGGKATYVGPCPPDREHRYIFTLYALDTILSLAPGSTKEQLLNAIATHTIEKAVLIGRYNRR